LMKAWKTTY